MPARAAWREGWEWWLERVENDDYGGRMKYMEYGHVTGSGNRDWNGSKNALVSRRRRPVSGSGQSNDHNCWYSQKGYHRFSKGFQFSRRTTSSTTTDAVVKLSTIKEMMKPERGDLLTDNWRLHSNFHRTNLGGQESYLLCTKYGFFSYIWKSQQEMCIAI